MQQIAKLSRNDRNPLAVHAMRRKRSFHAHVRIVIHAVSVFLVVSCAMQVEHINLQEVILDLGASDPSVRAEAERQLIETDDQHIISEIILHLERSADIYVIASALNIVEMSVDNPSMIKPLVEKALGHQKYGVRNAAFHLVRKLPVTDRLFIAEDMLGDENIVVKVNAAKLILESTHDSSLLPILIEGLSSDATEIVGDPPQPVCMISKALLAEWKDRDELLRYLETLKPATERTKYHILDLIAYHRGKMPSLIYQHIGEPTPVVKKKLGGLRGD